MSSGSGTSKAKNMFALEGYLYASTRALFFASLLSSVIVMPASAFELFGYKIGSDGIKKVSQKDIATDIPDPIYYRATLKSSDTALSEDLVAASILLEQEDKPVSGNAGLLVRARGDQKRLIAALYEKGYYGGTVDIKINGRPFNDISLDETLRENGNPAVSISVDPGPVFSFSAPHATLADGSPLSLADLGVVEGAIARSDLVLDAEDILVRRYQEQGYPFARISERQLEADHKTNKLDVSLEVDPGPQARLGAIQVSGTKDVDAAFISQQTDIEQGRLYSPEELKAATKRLQELGVFGSVIVKTGDTVGPDGTVPVLIDVKERKPRTIGVGITMGTLDGMGLEAFWTHRNLFGRAEKLRVEGSVSRIGQDQFTSLDYHGGVIFSKPGVLGPAGTFEAKAAADFTNPDAYEKRAVSGEVGLRYAFTDRLSGRAAVKLEFSRIKDSDGTQSSLLVSTPLELSYDARDNKLDPTQGFQILLEAEPTISNQDTTRFLKTSVTATAYQALDEAKRFVLAGKVSSGTIVGASRADIPADRRYYAGGGGSIRGYAYQAAGPRDRDNDPLGGRSYALASVEMRTRVTDNLGLALFTDTGGVFDSTVPGKKGNWYTGVGAGVRYLTPIGPLRLDVAFPLKRIKDEPQYGVYLGLGQAF